MEKQLIASRRSLIGGAAAALGGLTLGFHIPQRAALAQGVTPIPPEINAWVVIKRDDTVVIRIARSEIGQGALTSLAQLVAEELECDWSKVTTEYPTPGQNLARNRVWREYGTGGSRGIRLSHEYVRQGGAAAREMLRSAAAKEWGVPAGDVVARNSVLTHVASGRSATYGQMADAAATIEPPRSVELKNPKDWRVIGQPLARLDTAPRINGGQVYGIDVKLPGMLNAAIKACPVFGGTLASFDAVKARAMPGVHQAFQVGNNAVAVVADSWWQAKSALEAVTMTWNEGDHGGASSEGFAEVMKEGLTSTKDVSVGNSNGAALAVIAAATRTVEAVYSYPHQNQAALEPMNATALWTTARCEVWCGTQDGEAALAAGCGCRRTAPAELRRLQAPSRRRFRPSCRLSGFCHPGCPHRQTDARYAGQADLEPRGGHDAGILPSRVDGQGDRHPRRQGKPCRATHAPVGPVDRDRSTPAGNAKRQGSYRVPRSGTR